jgi:hypothetical protein
MKKIFFSVICIFVAHIEHIHAKIVQSYAISDIRTYINPALKPEEVLIILDVDNTTATSINQLASTQWFIAMRTLKEQCGLSKEQAAHVLLPLYSLLVPHCPLQPVESTTAPLIKELQDNGYKVMSLTLRSSHNLKTCTINQLNDIGIDFTHNNLYAHDVTLNDKVLYTHGILFVHGGHKGKLLFQFLKQIRYMPKQIIFIDDKEYNVLDVEDTLVHCDIDHTGIWYRYCDAQVDSFELSLTQDDLQALCNRCPEINQAYQQWLRASHDVKA